MRKLVESTFCDFCDNKADRKCNICSRDICYSHSFSITRIIGDGSDILAHFYFCTECFKTVKENSHLLHKIIQESITAFNTTVETIVRKKFGIQIFNRSDNG